jgi:copper chaperone CopZ
MKNLLKIFVVLMLIITTSCTTSSAKSKKIKEIKILTSAISKECKRRIEHNIKFEKGVKFVDLDLKTKVLTLKYKTNKTNPEKLRLAVSKLGYDADDVKADITAYNKLPKECKPKPAAVGG